MELFSPAGRRRSPTMGIVIPVTWKGRTSYPAQHHTKPCTRGHGTTQTAAPPPKGRLARSGKCAFLPSSHTPWVFLWETRVPRDVTAQGPWSYPRVAFPSNLVATLSYFLSKEKEEQQQTPPPLYSTGARTGSWLLGSFGPAASCNNPCAGQESNASSTGCKHGIKLSTWDGKMRHQATSLVVSSRKGRRRKKDK